MNEIIKKIHEILEEEENKDKILLAKFRKLLTDLFSSIASASNDVISHLKLNKHL